MTCRPPQHKHLVAFQKFCSSIDFDSDDVIIADNVHLPNISFYSMLRYHLLMGFTQECKNGPIKKRGLYVMRFIAVV